METFTEFLDLLSPQILPSPPKLTLLGTERMVSKDALLSKACLSGLCSAFSCLLHIAVKQVQAAGFLSGK